MSQDSARSGAYVWFCGSDMHRVEYVEAKVVHCAWLTALSGFRLGGAAFQAILSWLVAPAWATRAVAASAGAEPATINTETPVPAAMSRSTSRRRKRCSNGRS